jgi:transposase
MSSLDTQISADEPMPTGTTRAIFSQHLQKATYFTRRPIETRMQVLRAVKRGLSVADTSKMFKVSKRVIYKWQDKWRTERSLAPKPHTGRPRKLDAGQVTDMLVYLDQHPTATNADIVAATEVPIVESTVSKYLKRNGITRKKVSDEPVNWPDERVKGEIRDYLAAVEQIPFDKRVYMDESFAYTNEARTHGRSEKGKRISRPRERHGKRLTFMLAVRQDGLVHDPDISKENAKDPVFLAYVRDILVPNLRAGETVIWDRLGRSGRALNPTKQRE